MAQASYGEEMFQQFETCKYYPSINSSEQRDRFVKVCYLAKTLQGYTCKVFDKKDKVLRCVKVADRELIKKSFINKPFIYK